jgi:hypothetical protein
MVRVRFYTQDGGTPRAVGFLDFFDQGEAPLAGPVGDLPPGLVSPEERQQLLRDLSRQKVVGKIGACAWRVEYA